MSFWWDISTKVMLVAKRIFRLGYCASMEHYWVLVREANWSKENKDIWVQLAKINS